MTNAATIFFTGGGRYIHVRGPYNDNFAAVARQCRRQGRAQWDGQSRSWAFDAYAGVTLAWVESTAREHFGAVSVVQGGIPPMPQQQLPHVDAGFYGAIGQKVAVPVVVTKTVDLQGQYGSIRLHLFKAPATGHVFMWRASSERLDVGDAVVLTGTVKKHELYRGVSQTILSRCKAQPQMTTTQTTTTQTTEWFEQPWACGHRDPAYVNKNVQECAVCGVLRFAPGYEPPTEPPRLCHSCESNPHVKGCPYVEYLGAIVPEPKHQPTLAEEVGF